MIQQFVSQLRKEEVDAPIPSLVATLLKHEKNEKEVIEQLEELLEERKRSLNQEEE